MNKPKAAKVGPKTAPPLVEGPQADGPESLAATGKGKSRSTRKKTAPVSKSGSDPDPCDWLFDRWEDADLIPDDYEVHVPIDSHESGVGYSSLFRQMHQAYVRQVAYHRSAAGGSLSIEEARARAFHACTTKEEAKKRFSSLMGLPVENLNFADLMELQGFAPKVAEHFWERTKLEGRKEFYSGHLGANISFPVGYMKQVWNIARYLGVRESFIDDWQPSGGIEMSLIDMLTQAYFQWQYWLEQTVRRSQTSEREQHPEYAKWMARREKEMRVQGWTDGYWFRPFVSEQQALEHSVQMADRWNRIYMRTLRQLRDLRRYAPVTINNANQVNIAADGGQQLNVAATDGKD
ncbi:MAG TPA: hypothetical protein VGO43_13715 [Pyrinomonadaceae bacterium]|jgi:hypothetical protein|nr:hypothetical protein [Pyrinomonadaceae bacterium]